MADVAAISPISRLLIANRGEIARRIIRTARELGISTVAVYADGDLDAPFVHEADTAIALGGRTPAETYLDIDKVLNACLRSGAQAVHPGYGFLSENERFARAVVEAGLRWIGPSPEVIGLMGDKLSAKRLMREAGVPTLQAIEIDANTNIAAAADRIGYPVLVKAAAGGGGRGMRIVERAAELADAVASARREAGASFGDDTVFLERWLDSCRHVEIQIIGDSHGNVAHCFERECSIQRRHQKIIEEAPSPAVTPEAAAAHGKRRHRRCPALGLQFRWNRRVPGQRQRVLVPGSECPASGRASGHRSDYRQGPCARADPHRRRRSPILRPRRSVDKPDTPSKRACMRKTRNRTFCRLRERCSPGSPRPLAAHGSIPGWRAARSWSVPSSIP